MRAAAYPGSFDPPTVAHLAIADAARRQAGLDRVDLIMSEVALGKESRAADAHLLTRRRVLEAMAADRSWLGVQVTSARLLVDIAAGYDVLIVGADKWSQLIDPAWYGSAEARDRVLEQIPPVLVAPRPPHPLPESDPPRVVLLDLDAAHEPVSSSAVRAGRSEWMVEEAAAIGVWGSRPPTRPGH